MAALLVQWDLSATKAMISCREEWRAKLTESDSAQASADLLSPHGSPELDIVTKEYHQRSIKHFDAARDYRIKAEEKIKEWLQQVRHAQH